MSLIAELKRRNVFRVAAAYGIVAWILVEVAHTAFPTLQLPDWTITLVTVLLIMGFPVALVIAWAFELTPAGIKRESVVDPAESITRQTGRKLDSIIIGAPPDLRRHRQGGLLPAVKQTQSTEFQL